MDPYQKKALDLLREVNTIGAARVATALSELLKSKVGLTFPEAEFISFKDLVRKFDYRSAYFIVETHLEGDISGRLAFLLHLQDAQALGGSLLRKDPGQIEFTDPLFQSSLRETVNIFAGAYTEVLSEMTRLSIFYNVPFLNQGLIEDYLRSIPDQACNPELTFSINTMLSVQNISFKGALLLLLDGSSITRLFEAFTEHELTIWIEMMKIKNKEKGGRGDLPNIEYLS